MSKILYAVFKESKPGKFSSQNIMALSEKLQPDNIKFHPPKIIEGNRELVVLFNYNESISIHDKSICLGNMINPSATWWKPDSEVPDGTYAIFRADSEYFEAITDMLATRTIWYFHDEEVFLASTSQRAIIFFLESFEFNDNTVPWMLSTGSLGPGYSWDRRVKMLKGESSLLLGRKTWDILLKRNECEFVPEERNEEENQKILRQAIQHTYDNLELDFNKWVLPLSGGYDSRGILCMLSEKDELKCITWGVEAAQYEKGNDAFIAKDLAKYYKKKHKYFLTDLSDEPVEKIFNRFLICGEGRVDHISGYMDGFKLWKDLFEEGIAGVIRGDVVFGMSDVLSEMDVRFRVGFPFLSDFQNMKTLKEYGVSEQKVPVWMHKRDGETNETYRDRLFYEYRHANILAALNDLKLPYVEIINPQVSQKILTVVKQLPDESRNNKRLYKKIVSSLNPDIPFAKAEAVINHTNILKHRDVIEEIQKILLGEEAKDIFSHDFLLYVTGNLKQKDEEKARSAFKIKNHLKNLLSKKFRRLLRNTIAKPTLSFNELAFRAYIVVKMNKLLIEDSKFISKH